METIDATLVRCEAFIAENYPDVDISPGSVLSELVAKIAATINNELTNKGIDDLKQSKTVQDVLASESDTYSDSIDAIASNYNVYRNPGSKVLGNIKVEVAERRTYFVEKGFTFTQPNLNFNYITTLDYEITTGTVTSSNQLPLYQSGSQYYFILPVEAEEVGEEAVAGNKNNTQVTNKTRFEVGDGFNLTGFVSAEAYGNFSGGKNKETDRELITRFKEGLSYKGLSSPKAMTSVFKDTYPEFRSLSVVGANDSEVGRSKSNIFGISTLGMADVYVRTSQGIATIQKDTDGVNLVATRDVTQTGIWKLKVLSGVVPGFYKVVSIAPKGSSSFTGTYVIKKTTYGYELPTLTRNNHISQAIDARYTKYQTCDIEFEYDSLNSTEDFTVTFSYMPLVKDIQDYILSDDNRIISADYLVKAAIPCNVSIGLNLHKRSSSTSLPIADIKKDIFDYVNSIPFGEDLIVSNIIDICHNYDIKRVDLPVTVTGTIWVPSTTKDETIIISSQDVLTIPEQLDKGISKKTTTFFLTYFDDVGGENIGIQEV